jgi:hypothetical protein
MSTPTQQPQRQAEYDLNNHSGVLKLLSWWIRNSFLGLGLAERTTACQATTTLKSRFYALAPRLVRPCVYGGLEAGQ